MVADLKEENEKLRRLLEAQAAAAEEEEQGGAKGEEGRRRRLAAQHEVRRPYSLPATSHLAHPPIHCRRPLTSLGSYRPPDGWSFLIGPLPPP